MNLTAPKSLTFFISAVIALVAIAAALALIPALPLAAVWIMTIAYALLAAAVLLPGL